MNGFIAKTASAVCLAGALAATQGCVGYRDVVDPCYPARYNYAAREEVKACFGPQVANGHVLDQTIWNYYFEHKADGLGTDELTPGGQAHLAYLARRRPQPDTCVFLQTAQDLPFDAAHPERLVEDRAKLDQQRIVAIQRFLNAQTAGRPVAFQVYIHDPAEVGVSAIAENRAAIDMDGGYRGNLLGGGATAIGGTSASGTPAGGTGTR
jgi:hypothetical protein